jgi:ABC-type ATPase with predicted acetyltransferase domain/ASC-1-like (ASCH) protein
MTLTGIEVESDITISPHYYHVTSVTRRDHYKRLCLNPGRLHFDVPLSACVTENDKIIISDGVVSVACKHNNKATLLPIYAERETLQLGDLEVGLLVKEVTEDDEYQAIQSLTEFHYRNSVIYGRTAKLIIRSFNPLFPKVLGYVELASPLYMNKARSNVLNAPFRQNGISWTRWDKESTRQYINLMVRIARCVIYPEFRGLGLGQMLIRHAARFAADRWQVAQTKPLFLEISADMLKFVPFAKRAGMTFIGETEGNLGRVYDDVEYLLRNSQRIIDGEIIREESSGIVGQQVTRMQRVFKLIDQEGITPDDLLERLQKVTQEQTLKDFALFHEIINLSKPTYMQGLTPQAEEFIRERAASITSDTCNNSILNIIAPITSPVRLNNLTVSFHSQVRRTRQSHAVQQAFGISPDSIDTPVLRGLTADIKPGQIVLVLGPSGSGKTTLMEHLARSESQNTANIGIEFPDNYHPGVFQSISSKKALIEILADKKVDRALHLMGLVGLSDAYIYLKRFDELSKGQQFRAMLARLIVSQANVWHIDEFCTNLDPVSAHVVADKLQRTARQLGATVVVAAPHCQYFLHSLKPDMVIQLTTAWQHSVMSGKEFMKQVNAPQNRTNQPQSLLLRAEYFTAVRQGKKTTTIRKGKSHIKEGLLLLEGGGERQVVYVSGTKYCQLRNLTVEDALADGYDDIDSLLEDLYQIYPKLEPNKYVTIIKFHTLTTPI